MTSRRSSATHRPILGRAPWLESWGCAPSPSLQLRHRDEKAGQLIAISRKPDAFTQGDLDTLELLSVVLSSALSHAAEFESKRQQLDALTRFQTMYQEAAIGITLVGSDGRSRRAATQALLVTTMGGLAMLVGIVVLGNSAGTLPAVRADRRSTDRRRPPRWPWC